MVMWNRHVSSLVSSRPTHCVVGITHPLKNIECSLSYVHRRAQQAHSCFHRRHDDHITSVCITTDNNTRNTLGEGLHSNCTQTYRNITQKGNQLELPVYIERPECVQLPGSCVGGGRGHNGVWKRKKTAQKALQKSAVCQLTELIFWASLMSVIL